MATSPITESDQIISDLRTYFINKDRLSEPATALQSGRTLPRTEPNFYLDPMVAAENRLRSVVGLPIVANRK